MKKAVIFSISGIILAFALLTLVSGFLTDLWWFVDLGFAKVFWVSYQTQFFMWLAGFAISFAFITLVMRIDRSDRLPAFPKEIPRQIRDVLDKLRRHIPRVVAFAAAAVMAFALARHWDEFLLFAHPEGFGMADPVFGHDAGFYIFTLPFLEAVRSWLMWLGVVCMALLVVPMFLHMNMGGGVKALSFGGRTRIQFAIPGALLVLAVASGFWLSRYDILASQRSGSFFGAGYTDVHARLPLCAVMAVLTLAAGGVLIAWVLRGKAFKGMKVLGGLFLLGLVAYYAVPGLVQTVVVQPTEQSRELPYIAENVKFTRFAYGMTAIEERSITPKMDVDAEDIRNDDATMRNVMLWDYRPMAATLDQLQVIRLYYDFSDMDIDRYRFPNGDYRQVILGARELNQSKLPANAGTWVNQRFVYTHGYGLTMSPVNVVTEEGLPEFFLKDIPPKSSVGIDVKRPEIYFGEKTQGPVIVNGNKIEEFDYPEGDNNRFCKYGEDAGVSISSLFERLVFALRFQEINMVLSGYIGADSRILYYRNIRERMAKIAPFLSYDEDPYIVVVDGRLHWICDAYTTTVRFPYSKPYKEQINYIRNSVKVVVDAYTGRTVFYKIGGESDPLVRAYDRMYPGLFRPFEEMPQSLREHVRYPQDLFDVQSSMLEAYHMEDPQVFYNKEDLWSIANEKIQEGVNRMESYFALIRLPGEPKEEFILMIPYTPNKRDNMIAWLCARSDGKNYGRLLVYKFPKQDLTYGPMQIAARIDQDPVISQQLTLWNQQGSSVSRGNLLVIPVKDDVVYIQPIYLQATTGKMPQLKRVIAVYGNRLSMETNLERAMVSVFGSPSPLTATPPGGAAAGGATASTMEKPAAASDAKPTAEVARMAQAARDHYEKAVRFQRDGNWAKYGEELEALKKVLEAMAGGGK